MTVLSDTPERTAGAGLPARLARYAWLPTAFIALAGLVFMVLSLATEAGRSAEVESTATMLIIALALLPIGAIVTRRQPGNPIGWIYSATSFCFVLGFATWEYVVYGYLVRPGLPGVEAAAWVQAWFWLPALFMPVTLLLQLFPNGRVLTRRWRLLSWLTVAALLAGTISAAGTPGALDGIEFAEIENPLGTDEKAELVTNGAMVVLGLAVIASFASLVVRFRRSSGRDHEQLRFVLPAFALCLALLVVAFAVPSDDWSWPLVVLGISGIPIATGVAIIRHRLWDIDVIVRRTLVYAAVSALLAGLYFGTVIGLQAMFGGLVRGNDLAIAGSTLAVAALFRPVRARIQAFVDRRFYRRRYDTERTLAAFSARLRDEVDLDELGADLGHVVRETMQPAHVSLWLRRDSSP